MNGTQDYFWTPEWQEAEKEADEDIKMGRIIHFDNAENAIRYLRNNYGADIKEVK